MIVTTPKPAAIRGMMIVVASLLAPAVHAVPLDSPTDTPAVVPPPAASSSAVPSSVVPLQPVTLRQNWVADQQLRYDMLFDGRINLLLPADPKGQSLFAGLPLQFDVKAKGQTNLDTLAVDEFGTGTVAVTVPQFKLMGSMLGQKIEMNLENGQGQFKMNNEIVGDGINWPFLGEAKSALLISPRGRVEAVAELEAVETAAQERPVAAAKGDTGAPPIDYGAMLKSLLFDSIPVLWPQGEIKPGETWTAEIRRPSQIVGAATPNAGAGNAPGTVKMTLRGEEAVAGRKTQRIAVEGAFKFDKNDAQAQIDQLPDQQKQATLQNMEWLNGASQKFNGDIWFDAVAGQVVRVEVSMRGQTATPAPGAKPAGWFDLNGQFQMQLAS